MNSNSDENPNLSLQTLELDIDEMSGNSASFSLANRSGNFSQRA
jgi:hypothetical protein